MIGTAKKTDSDGQLMVNTFAQMATETGFMQAQIHEEANTEAEKLVNQITENSKISKIAWDYVIYVKETIEDETGAWISSTDIKGGYSASVRGSI